MDDRETVIIRLCPPVVVVVVPSCWAPLNEIAYVFIDSQPAKFLERRTWATGVDSSAVSGNFRDTAHRIATREREIFYF